MILVKISEFSSPSQVSCAGRSSVHGHALFGSKQKCMHNIIVLTITSPSKVLMSSIPITKVVELTIVVVIEVN